MGWVGGQSQVYVDNFYQLLLCFLGNYHKKISYSIRIIHFSKKIFFSQDVYIAKKIKWSRKLGRNENLGVYLGGGSSSTCLRRHGVDGVWNVYVCLLGVS